MPDPEPFDAGQSTYSVALPSFEGPLDLLLHLCQKHELNILEIPISFVTEKYLEYLAVMQLMDLDIASEYLLMAATLAHIKSKMLLPSPPPGQEDDAFEDEEDPREALIRRLLEYQKYKQAAADLSARGMAGRDIFTRGAPIEEASDEGLARVLLVLERVVLLPGRGRGEQHLGLDVRERRGHHQVFARHVEVEELEDGEVLEVLLGHEADRDVEDVELMLLAEVQKQVERTLEGRQGYGIAPAA